jgi:hypothetical protein
VPQIATLILLLASFSYASFEEEWIKKHAIALGIDLAITKGDLDGISKIEARGENIKSQSVILPEVPFFLVYAIEARGLVNASSIAINFGIGFPEYEHNLQNGDARYWRFGIEYQYHFFWPSFFRIGAGLGYVFSSMKFSNASVGEDGKQSYANFIGNGPNAVLSASCYLTENFAIEYGIRYKLLYFNRVSTTDDMYKLDKAVWQSMGELGLRGMFVF